MAITNKDIEKLSGVFATKKDLEELSDKFATKDDLRNLKDEILTSQDKIIKKIEDITIEMKMSYGQYRRQEDKLENHEGRIKVLEDKVLTP